MLRRHIFSKEFFSFLLSICEIIKTPELASKDPTTIIYSGHLNIPPKTQKSYQLLIKLLMELMYSVLGCQECEELANDVNINDLQHLHSFN